MIKSVTIRKIDAKRAEGYCDVYDCLLATAAKRQFKTQDVCCLTRSIKINRIEYKFNNKVYEFLNGWPYFRPGEKSLQISQEKKLVVQQLPYKVELTHVPSI